jgi:uncharacterized integral membrane protein
MLKFILGIVMGAAAVIFAAQNTEITTVGFLAWQITMSRSLMILIVLFFGIVIGWIVGGLGRRRAYR